jgi:RNA polymerase sigma-70 factor (ECF subfamily)
MSVITLHGVPSLITLSPSDEAARPHIDLMVRRLRARDAALIERLLRELLPRVRQWALRLIGPKSDLDDAVQDSMSEIASALHRFEGRSSVATLAHTIVLRTSYRFFRKRSRIDASSVDLDAFESEDEDSDPERRALSREILARIYGCLEHLVPQRRTAFVLCCVDGLSPTEAAAIEGCTALAMRSRLFHARADLEKLMERDELLAPLVREKGAR